jgi:hypothetical protein
MLGKFFSNVSTQGSQDLLSAWYKSSSTAINKQHLGELVERAKGQV